MATLTQDGRFVGVSLAFFDDHVPARPATIDVSDRQPTVLAADPTVLIVSNVVVAADGKSMSFDVDSAAVGASDIVVDVDVNMANGVDTSLVLRSENVDVVPGVAGPAVTASFTFPAESPKA